MGELYLVKQLLLGINSGFVSKKGGSAEKNQGGDPDI
jgi:hypothetical protein